METNTETLYYGMYYSTTNFYGNNMTTEEVDVKKLASSYFVFKFGAAMHRYWLPIMSTIGLVGNSISLSVMRQVSHINYVNL